MSGKYYQAATEKIRKEKAEYKGSKYGMAMKKYTAKILEEFCGQKEEFARAVAQGGSFAECMEAIEGKIKGQSISDLDVCRGAAEFYFPGSVVDFRMEIHMSRYEAQEREQGGEIHLKLEDFLA